MNTTQSYATLVQPPAGVLTAVTNPATGQADYAFALQTAAWLKMQTVVQTALTFPLTQDDFTNRYGSFSDEDSVVNAVSILSAIQKTSSTYGDPQTLISSLPDFESATTPPDSIYGHAVWLAAQTQGTAQQIATLLNEGLTDIGKDTDPQTRLEDLTELLTGEGGIDSLASALQSQIASFGTAVSAFYDTLNGQLTGPTNSLQTYLDTADNVCAEAQDVVNQELATINSLTQNLHDLNGKYTGYVAAASVAPVFLLIPLVGVFLAVADATTFGVLATQVKQQIDNLQTQLASVTEDEQKKAALVTVLKHFNLAAQDVAADGKDFVSTIATMAAGWADFASNITTLTNSLTADDLSDWSAFMQKLEFQDALTGWNTIASKAEYFFQNGFVQFSSNGS